MNILMYIFSGTGNTWWTVHTFKRLAEERNINVIIKSIEKMSDPLPSFNLEELKSVDILGLAYPIYGSTWPRNVKNFTLALLKYWENNLAELDVIRPPILVLTSMMLFSGDGAIVPRQNFIKHGFPFRWAINIPLTSNISVPTFKANPYTLAKIIKKKLKAEPKLHKLLDKISNDKSWLEHRLNLFYRLLAKIQRISEPIMYKMVNFTVDHDVCTRCKQCLQYCPMHNISLKEDTNTISIGSNCVLCMRCYNICPVYAVKSGKKLVPHQNIDVCNQLWKDFPLKIFTKNRMYY